MCSVPRARNFGVTRRVYMSPGPENLGRAVPDLSPRLCWLPEGRLGGLKVPSYVLGFRFF